MTRFPRNATHEPLWFAFANTLSEEVPATQGVVFAAQGFGPTEQPEYARALLSGRNKCGSVQDYDRLRAGTAAGLPATSPCVVLTHNLFPRDVWSADSPFAEFARWLYYGRRKVSCCDVFGVLYHSVSVLQYNINFLTFKVFKVKQSSETSTPGNRTYNVS